MGVKIADKLEQFNNGTYYLVDSSAVEYVDKDGNTKSVKEALDGTSTDTSTHKTVIFENNIDMGKYLLLAKITGANYSNNIIKFSCPNYKGVNDAGFKYEDDMDIYKFELHFNTGARRETNSYGVTLKQHGLGLYSYPLSNPKNTEPGLEEAIRLYWDYSKGDIYVFLVDMMTAIPHCVLEYTGSGTLLRENTFVMDDLYNRRDGLNGTWEESKWKSIPFNKLEIPPIHELGGGSTEGVKTYTAIEDLGLTAPITVGEIFNAMADGSIVVLACEDIADYITDVPMSYGLLTIKKKNNSRFSIDYQNSLGGSAVNVKRWIGTLKGTDGTGLYWKEMQAENGGLVTSDTITKYGTEILKYPIGTWYIDNVNIAKQFTDLPYPEMPGIIEIDSIQPTKSPYEHSYGYRNYTFRDALNSTIYTRSLNSGTTAGTMSRDSGWCTTGSHFYKLSQMYLSANVTIQDVIDALPIGGTALLRTDEFTNWSTLFNGVQWGYLKVEKTINGLSNIELQEVVTPNRRYFGTQSSGKFSSWKQIASEITNVLTNTSKTNEVPNANLVANEIHGKYFDIADYSNALAMPAGKWRVDSNNKASQIQNLPIQKAGILEVKYLQGNDGNTSYTGAFKYAMLTYTAISGEKYERSFNSDGTVGNIVNDTGWRTVITENSKTDPYSCDAYKRLTGTEDLFTLSCGHYLTEKANTAYNYPITDSSNLTAHIYVLGHLNDKANNKGYRNILYFDNKGRTYNANEWWGTFGSWNRLDNDARVTTLETQVSELFQSVSSGKTLVANAITGKGVSTATNATFATMATNIGKISGGYKEETKSLIVTSNTTGTEALKFTFSANVIAVKQIVAPSDSCRILPQTSKNMFTITGKELIVHVTGSGTWKATALIEK